MDALLKEILELLEERKPFVENRRCERMEQAEIWLRGRLSEQESAVFATFLRDQTLVYDEQRVAAFRGGLLLGLRLMAESAAAFS